MNKPVMTLLVCLLMVVFSGSSMAADRWKLGHLRPAGSAVDTDLKQLVQEIETGSSIRIDIHPAGKLGDYALVQERVSFGEVDMFVGPFGTAIDKRLSLAFTPFLVSDWETAKTVYSPASPLFTQMQAYLTDQNIKLLGGWPVYFGGIATTREPAGHGDPDIQRNLIIRVPPFRCFEQTARELGYTPYPITWTYAKMGLKTGMVEGIIGGGAEGYLGLKDIVRYYVPVRDHFEYWFVYMNLAKWNRLSDKEKQTMTDACRRMEEQRYRVAQAQEQLNMERLKQNGVTILDITDAEYDAMKQKIRQTVWPEMRREIGPAFDTVVQSAATE